MRLTVAVSMKLVEHGVCHDFLLAQAFITPIPYNPNYRPIDCYSWCRMDDLMLHKLGYIYECDECHRPVHADEQGCVENNLCESCRDKWEAEQIAHYLPKSPLSYLGLTRGTPEWEAVSKSRFEKYGELK